MGDMQSDLNKYAKIWDDALQKGIFNDVPKEDPSKNSTDFFGQYLNAEYDMDKPLNEVDTKYWAILSRRADPLFVEGKKEEDEAKANTASVINAHNPIQPNSAGKDQESPKSFVLDDENINKLEELKNKLHDLENDLNSLNAKSPEKSDTSVQSKIDSLKKQIDDLSDSLTGNRFTRGG